MEVISGCLGVVRSNVGMVVSWDDWLEGENLCYPDPPDFLLDVESPPEVVTDEYDLLVVQVSEWSRPRPGVRASNQQWLARSRSGGGVSAFLTFSVFVKDEQG